MIFEWTNLKEGRAVFKKTNIVLSWRWNGAV